MGNKQLIVRLIQQDLKHCQFLNELNRVGLGGNDKHDLALLDIIYDLMNVPQSIEIDWGQVYAQYVHAAKKYPITEASDSLRPLAKKCYKHLKCIVDLEDELLSGC